MNPYRILGLSGQATPEDIRAAYRRRALELHPDHSGSGAEPFLELQEAYGILSDPQRRSAWDRKRPRGVVEPLTAPHRGAEPLRPVEPASGFREVSMFDSFDTYSPSWEELFDRWQGNLALGSRPKSERMESLTVDVPLSADQAACGGQMLLSVPARVPCRSCRGGGAVGGYLCWRCGGTGSVSGEVPLRVAYPAGLLDPYVVRLRLDRFGIRNTYLTVRFRVSAAEAL
jgi:DnaJ-class molecular chaperone